MSISAGTRRISSSNSTASDDHFPHSSPPHHHHPMRHRPLLHIRDTDTNRRLVLGMVGLPARGKTYIAKKICRYLTWLGYKVRVFNVGQYRRQLAGTECSSTFFDPNNQSGAAIRTQCATAALHDLTQYFEEGGQAAIYDATNSTKERRAMVAEILRNSKFNCELVWIESICNDQDIVANNIRDTKLFSPDYANKDATEAVADFQKRIEIYQQHYETVHEDELTIEQSYVKLIDGGRRVETCEINGYLPARIVFFLMHLQINHNPIFVSRHGESEYNVLERLGGDSGLSENGMKYAKILAQFIKSHSEISRLSAETDTRLQIWCSTLKRTVQTATAVYEACPEQYDPIVQWRALCEIDAGVCDGLTYPEVEAKDPEGFAARQRDKLGYRYPQGESYLDVIDRLEPVIFEIERAKGPILVIGHQAVLRCLFGYFLDVPMSDIAFLDVPLHNVIKLTPKAYGCQIEHFQLLEDPHAKKTKAAHAAAKQAHAAAAYPPVSPSAGLIGATATSPPSLTLSPQITPTPADSNVSTPKVSTPIITTNTTPSMKSTTPSSITISRGFPPPPLNITSPIASFTPPLTATATASSGFIPIVGSTPPSRTVSLEEDLEMLGEEKVEQAIAIATHTSHVPQQGSGVKRHSKILGIGKHDQPIHGTPILTAISQTNNTSTNHESTSSSTDQSSNS